jgi:hypothetical protein
MGRAFLSSGGTTLPSSKVYGSNVDPRLLQAYLPKDQSWSEPRFDQGIKEREAQTKIAKTVRGMQGRRAKAGEVIADQAAKKFEGM